MMERLSRGQLQDILMDFEREAYQANADGTVFAFLKKHGIPFEEEDEFPYDKSRVRILIAGQSSIDTREVVKTLKQSGIDPDRVEMVLEYDDLQKYKWTALQYSDKYCDVILMNPPFGGEIAPGEDSNFPASYRTSETANLFVCLVLYRLKQHGRVGIILPDGFLFGNDDASVKLKEKLLKECNLHTIVKLPSGLFYANITTNILFFEKGRKTEGIWYYQVPLPEGYKSFSKTKPFKAEHLDDCRQWWHSRETENPNAWYVSFDQIYKRNYDLDVKNPNAKADPASEMTLAEILDEMSHESQTIAENLSKIKELLKDVSDD